jgi:hypothetical protein
MEDLRKYCHLAKEHSFIEVTEWENGEGIDVAFDDKIIQLSWGQLDAINVLAHYKD